MRTLIVTDVGDTPAKIDLSARCWIDVAQALLDSGVEEVSVASMEPPSEFHERLADAELGAVALGRQHGYDIVGPTRRLTAELRRRRYDVLHAHAVLPSIVAAMATKRIGRGKTIFHRHHVRSSLRREVGSALATALTDRTIVVSDAVWRSAWMGSRGTARTVRIYNGTLAPREVQDAEVAALRSWLGLETGAEVVLCVSRLSPEKGVDVLVHAMDLLASTSPQVHAVIAGSGPTEGDLRRSIGNRLRGRVHLVGHQEDVTPWYALAEIVVVPSRREALSQVVMEAMAAGRPVIASAVGGIPELVVDGTTGVLIPPEDPAALSSAIADLLSKPSTRRAIGEAARRRHDQHFAIRAMSDAHVALYRSLVPVDDRAGRERP